MTVRLASVAPDLVDVLSGTSDAQLRAVALEVAAWSAEEVGLSSGVAASTLARVSQGTVDLTVVSPDLAREVKDLDEEAWRLQELESEDERAYADYLRVFSQARAASAIRFALQDNPQTAALEAVYEAYAATGQLDALRSVVRQALARP